jgi:hypothetical protein
VEETQRFLVDQLFKISAPSTLAYALLNALLDEHSFVKLKHLRSELIEKGSAFYPLHRALLEARASQDYRAVLLWDAFYGEDLKSMAPPPSFAGRRRYELWTLTDSVSQSELFGSFTKYLEHLSQDKLESQASDFLEKAERIAQRLCKQFGVRKNLKISLQKEMPVPIKIVLSQPALILRLDFFELLDEEIWSALVTGALQLWDDRDKGLFDEKRLLERFFQGMLLSGSPLQKIIRLWVWLAISEGLIEPQVLKARPEQLIENLPFLNSLLVFYLSQNFAEKVQSCSLAVS